MREIKLIKHRAEQLDEVGNLAKRIANCMYSPNDRMWDILLKFSETLEKEYDKLTKIYYDKIKKQDAIGVLKE